MILMNNNLMSKRLITAMSAACLTGGLLAAAAAPANAAAAPGRSHRLAPASPVSIPAPGVRPDSSFEVVNYNSGLCLGISGDKNDQPAVQFTCNGNADQQWHWGSQNASYSGWYQLVNGNGSCLGVSGGSLSEGASVVGFSCLGSTHYDQYWTPLGYSCSGYVPLDDLNSNYVLGVSGNSTAVGAAVVQWAYQGACNNQFWYGL
jgi:Ricin-type beta-trefoil lectin domain-like